MRTKSCRHDAISMPSAEKVPGTFGTITFGMKISRAIATACSGPAPPNAIIAVSRGSTPFFTETARTASDIAASAICTMPSAASLMPSRVGPQSFCSMARSEALTSSFIAPLRKRPALIRPSTRLASVTTGSVEPLP